MLTAEPTEEAELWSRWRGAHDVCAREKLATMYMGHARIVAATYYARRFHDEIEFADYFQFASVGLMEALDRFDPSVGVQFRTFASRRMHGAILDGVERMTEKQQQISARARLRAERAEAIAGGEAGTGEGSAAPASRVPEQALNFIAEVGLGLALAWLLDGTGMVESREAAEAIPFYRSNEIREARQRVLSAVDALGPQQRRVIRGHYLQERPFEEIAREMGLTRGRISQIHHEALARLRQALQRPEQVNREC
jgi:RNA polymerase sigma factor for flagellar operon FliA